MLGSKKLVGLSEQVSIESIDSKYNVGSDLALDTKFYYKDKKPRTHKGESLYFTSVLSSIFRAESCIAKKFQTKFVRASY